MKNLLIILAFFSLLACKKKDDTPAPVTPDYADSLVGTYIGHEIDYSSDNYTKLYDNSSKTMIVTKMSKNRIKIDSLKNGGSPYFDLSDRGDGNVHLSPEGWLEYSTGWNVYFLSTKQFNLYIKDGNPLYYRFQGTKQ